jgi:hypothetical protein
MVTRPRRRRRSRTPPFAPISTARVDGRAAIASGRESARHHRARERPTATSTRAMGAKFVSSFALVARAILSTRARFCRRTRVGGSDVERGGEEPRSRVIDKRDETVR